MTNQHRIPSNQTQPNQTQTQTQTQTQPNHQHRTPSNQTQPNQPNPDQILKSKFNYTISNFKKLQQTETKIVFLTRCQKENALPQSFKIPFNLPHLNTAEETIAKNVLNQTSKTLLKLALKSRKAQAIELNKIYWSSWHELINLKTNKAQDDLINQIEILEAKITSKLTTKSQKKFSWLKQSTVTEKTTQKIDESPPRKSDKGHRRFTKDLSGKESKTGKRKRLFLHCTTILVSI